MHHDLHPEALADKMSSEQRLNQFVIRDPFPIVESCLIVASMTGALLIAYYAEPLEVWLAGFGL